MTDVNISLSCGGFSSLLTILFIALKLLDKIDWSWFFVLSPILFPLIIVCVIVVVVLIVAWIKI